MGWPIAPVRSNDSGSLIGADEGRLTYSGAGRALCVPYAGPMPCPGCGEPTPPGARFCAECGYALLQRPDERRLVTVLMADIVGFTALSETADPETIKNLVDRCFQALVADITTFGGHLDKIVGDQIVAQFGAPIAHEDDAERAVRTALQMRESLNTVAEETGHQFALRIGINTGEVLVGAMRAGGDATVMGDVVNTASRLQTSAEPGEILVGAATHAATRFVVEYQPVGSLSVKGREEQVDAWRAIVATAPPGQRRKVRRAPLIGRDAEMGALTNTAEVAIQRSRAQLVLLLGDAGVGKSRIASELASSLSKGHGARVVRLQCAPYGEANVWAPIASALRDACGFEYDESVSERRAEVIALLATLPGIAHDSAEIDRIADGIIFITDGIKRAGVDPSRARDDAIRSVATFFEALATTAPLVVLASDIHWADELVLKAVVRVLRRLRSLPFILLATARPEFETAWIPPTGHHNTMVLHLDPLDAFATTELARELFGDHIDSDTLAFFQERSGGNPFFIEELVALVAETSDGPSAADRFGALPATLHGLVAARLDALASEERSLLEDFAVVGPQGLIETALMLSGRADAERVLRSLQDHDLIVLDDDEFQFKSELVREVAYSTLTKGERARRHAALADQILALVKRRAEAAGNELGENAGTASSDAELSPYEDSLHSELVAHHLACAAELMLEVGYAPGVPADIRTRAIAALQRAGRNGDAAESFIDAGRSWQRALDLVGRDPEPNRWEALLGRARAKDALRELDDARDDAMVVLEEARELNNDEFVARALVSLGRIEGDASNYPLSEAYFSEAITAFRALGDTSGVGDALRGLGVIRMFQGELDEAERLSSDALASFVATGNLRGEAWAQQTLAWISFARGSTADAEQRLHRSAEVFGEIGDWGGVGWALGLLAFVRFNQGNLDEAEELAQQIAIEASETGNRWAEGMMEVLLASIATWRGRSAETVERGKHAIAMFTEMADNWALNLATGPVIRALSTLGRFGEAEALLTDLDRRVAESPLTMPGIATLVRAAMLVERGEGTAALELARREWPETVFHTGIDHVTDTDRLLILGLAMVQSGVASQAVDAIQATYDAATDDGPRAAIGGLLTLALAADGKPEAALRVAEATASVRGGTFMDRLLMRWGCGLAFATQGAITDAVAALDEAHDLAYTTDSKLVRAISSVARARVFEALGVATSAEATNEASLALHGLGINAHGWSTAFSLPKLRIEQ